MGLIHSTYPENIEKILEEGILPTSDTGLRPNHPNSRPDLVYLLYSHGLDKSPWGPCTIGIDESWVRSNNGRLKGSYLIEEYEIQDEFLDYLFQNSITAIAASFDIDFAYFQVTSSIPIPKEALSLLRYSHRF
ncbi:MAG: hypothetical protein ACLFTR_02325 [Candidatus Woesearchaeota archaeon]